MAENELDKGDVLATMWAVLGALVMFGGLAVASVWTELTRWVEVIGLMSEIGGLGTTTVMLLSFLMGIVYLLAGYLLYKRFVEGKWLGTILSVLLVWVFPIGTIISLFTLWVLYVSDIKAHYTKTLEFEP